MENEQRLPRKGQPLRLYPAVVSPTLYHAVDVRMASGALRAFSPKDSGSAPLALLRRFSPVGACSPSDVGCN